MPTNMESLDDMEEATSISPEMESLDDMEETTDSLPSEMTEETVDSMSPETNEENINHPTEAVVKMNKLNSRRGQFRTKRRRVQIKPTDDPVRMLHLPSMTPQMIEEQQRLFNTFLQQTHDFQIAAVDSGRAALYRIHHEAGLGNIIRGYLTTFTIAILSNRTIQSTLF